MPPTSLLLLLALLAQAQRVRSADASTFACPVRGDPLGNLTRAVLTTNANCPQACSTAPLCLYFPRDAATSCAASSLKRPCLVGDTGCAFQCLPAPTSMREWSILLYAGATAPKEERKDGDATPYVPINTSQIGAWVDGDGKNVTNRILGVTFLGDQTSVGAPPRSSSLESNDPPRGYVVPFELPSTFFASHQDASKLELENVKYPGPPPDSNTSFVFPTLETLFPRNAQLRAMPLPLATFPKIQNIDLSMNDIKYIEKGALPARIQILDLSRNPLQAIPNGTLPNGIVYLYLDNASLTAIPADIGRMTKMTRLYLHNNPLEGIPDDALPAVALTMLSLSNCSLRGIPSSLSRLTKLTSLYIAENDLSQAGNFSMLPVALETLDVRSCRLQALPQELARLTKLTELSLADNPQITSSLEALPGSLRTLNLDQNGLESVPAEIQKLRQLETLTLRMNPLVRISRGSFPASLLDVSFSNISSNAIADGTLPASLKRISITESSLEETPRDIGEMQSLLSLNITSCQLRSFEFAKSLPLAQLDLSNNCMTKFSATTPALVQLDVRGNALNEFTLNQAPLLETLVLADNNLTSVPESLMKFPKLTYLNISGNPIRSFKPNVDQVDFLSKVRVVVFDQEMFAVGCETVNLQGYQVCVQQVRSRRNVSVSLILGNVSAAIILAVVVVALWRRRKLKQRELDRRAESIEKQRLNEAGSSIWTDPLLQHHRLDENLVDPIMLLGSGMFGEVWLASYCNEDVAVKRLKEGDRESILLFIDEIKLVLTLSHPRIVSGIGVLWTKESDIALVTEFLVGGDLRSLLDNAPDEIRNWPTQMVQIALDITKAIVYLHSFDPVVIHRDLKSRNVLLDMAMHAKLTDFGVSRFKVNDKTMTAGVGTVRWIAPEVLAGQRYDESADIYSLGVIMNEIDTRDIPFAHATDDSGTQQLTESAIAGLLISGSLRCQWTESCPSEIRSLGERCTAFDPRQRPSGVQVAFQLRRYLHSISGTTNF